MAKVSVKDVRCVVAPTSVGGNWIRELEAFAPGLNAISGFDMQVQNCPAGLLVPISVQVLNLSQQSASIIVTHRGTVEQLQRALAQDDLILQQGVGGWDLRVGSGVTRLNPTPLGAE